MNEDPKLSQRYRDLPREEPPRALDDAILAASRRAVQARPAPLVAPSGRRRWYVPLAAAAVITLSVAVTLHIQHDRPSEAVDAVSPAMEVQKTPAPAETPQAAARRAEAPRAAAPQAEERMRADDRMRQAESAPQPPTVARAPASASAPSPASAGARVTRDQQYAQGRIARSSIDLTPEAELERIARLRAAGRHEEADKALAEFRKRYPDYRLSDEMKAKVEKPQ